VTLESADLALREALRRLGAHVLRIEVPEGPGAIGLCLYGDATGAGAVPEGTGELPGRVEVSLVARAP
jgi:hypothetical protein